MRFLFVLRSVTVAALVACGLAILVARTAPRAASFSVRCDPRRAAFCGALFTPAEPGARVIDTETGIASELHTPPGDAVQWAAFSEWLDEGGQWQVVGRWVALSGGDGQLLHATGLGRFSYPSGRPLDRIPDCPIPVCAPCWFPGPDPRVVYPAMDGKLYRCVFGRQGSGGVARPAEIAEVSWPRLPAGLREPFVAYAVWPKTLGGPLIASVSSLDAQRRRGPLRLWWLRLSPDGSSVADAGPLSAGEHAADPEVEWRVPSVAPLRGGGQRIAYVRVRSRTPSGELVVAPLRSDAQTGAPAVADGQARILADQVLGMPAAFSPDGAWLYAVQRKAGAAPAIRRFSVTGDASRG
jgi:hypothetical protein